MQTNFMYAGEIRCSVCFPTTPLVPTRATMLEHALSKLGMTEEALLDEMLKLPAYTLPQNTYTCQSDKEHMCEPMCTTVADDFDAEELAFSDVTVERGLCCRAKYAEDKEHWCEACMKTSAKKVKQ